MKILLTGVNGQLGFELWRTLQNLGEVIPTTRKGDDVNGVPTVSLDLTDTNDIEKKLNAIQPTVICNPAAYTAVDKAESETDLAFAINAKAPAVLAHYAKQNESQLLHYSTDYVFPGNNSNPWIESHQPEPLGVYGQSKLNGEEAIQDSKCQHMIFRTAWVFSARGNNFLKTMLRLASTHKELNIVDDQIGSPTWAFSLANASTHCLMKPQTGIYHMTNSGKTSWCGFAKKIFAQAKALDLIENIPAVNPISTQEYPTPAKRPAYSVLNCEKLEQTFNISMPNWQTALSLCMQTMEKQT